MTTITATQFIGRHYRSGRTVQLELRGDKIAAVREVADQRDTKSKAPWIAPGFVDIQSNGYGGQEFSSPELTAEKVARIAAIQPSFGVTKFCPTVTTNSADVITRAMRAIVEAKNRWPRVARLVAGIHLEGPYISPEDGPRGAHPLAECRPPDWEEFSRYQEAADGQIRIVTLSAEYSESPAFIARAVRSGVVVAIGHTGADSAQIRAAVDAGATLSTHLGNGAHRMLRRHPNYLWDQLAEDRLMASLIVDGHHLPAEVVRTIVRAKSPKRCILISDLSGLAGLPAGRYPSGMCDLEILSDGRLVIAGQDQLLAGASRPIGAGVANVMRFAGIDLATAVEMATSAPTRLLGQPAHRLQPGDAADLTLFDLDPGADDRPSRLEVRATVAAGEVVYGAIV